MRLHDGDLTVIPSGVEGAYLITLWLPLSDENQLFPNMSSSSAIAPEMSVSEPNVQRISPLLAPEVHFTQSDIPLEEQASTTADTHRRGEPAQALNSNISTSPSQERRHHHRASVERLKILIVDDSPMVRKMINKMMTR